MKTPTGSKTKTTVWIVENGKIRPRLDQLTAEEPLEIRLWEESYSDNLLPVKQTVAVTMRSPGHDFELAAGFLYGEGIVHHRQDIHRIRYCVDAEVDGEQQLNIVNVALRDGLMPNLQPLERHFYTTSACGVCGKANLEALKIRGCPAMTPGPEIPAEIIYTLPDRLRSAQRVFSSTGGIHAAALFNAQGELLCVREDVGRHNALDKLVGAAFLNGELPWSDRILLVSGRSSFEILQKSLAAGVPIVCAVSAPSSLAVSLAQEFGMTLIGFLRGQRFNVYAGIERIQGN